MCQEQAHSPRKIWRLFDHLIHLIGTGAERRRHFQSKRLGGLELDHQLEFGWSLNRQVGTC
jgi:hypothetical protein